MSGANVLFRAGMNIPGLLSVVKSGVKRHGAMVPFSVGLEILRPSTAMLDLQSWVPNQYSFLFIPFIVLL